MKYVHRNPYCSVAGFNSPCTAYGPYAEDIWCNTEGCYAVTDEEYARLQAHPTQPFDPLPTPETFDHMRP